jgi:hypothetical protein
METMEIRSCSGLELNPQIHISGAAAATLVEVVCPVRNGKVNNKPEGGLWTSSLVNGSCSWRHYVEGIFKQTVSAGFLLNVDPKARLLLIDTTEDFVTALSEYDWMENPVRELGLSLDFERIARSYDGIHLTARGASVNRFADMHCRALPFGTHLYSWDCESTVWFRWRFTSCERFTFAAPGRKLRVGKF